MILEVEDPAGNVSLKLSLPSKAGSVDGSLRSTLLPEAADLSMVHSGPSGLSKSELTIVGDAEHTGAVA